MASSYKGSAARALVFPLTLVETNRQTNRRIAGDLRRHDTHYDVIVMEWW